MLSNRIKNHVKKMALLLIVISCLIPAFTRPAGEYRLLSWKGDVKIRTAGKFIPLTEQPPPPLKKGDGLWLAAGAEAELRFPGGGQKVVYGPRFTKVETLEKAVKGPSLLANLIKNTGVEELLLRKKEGSIGATRSGAAGRYEKIKKFIREMEEPPPGAGKEKEMKKMLGLLEERFDAAPAEKQVLIRARVYKHFNRDKQAALTVSDYYEKVLNLEGKSGERDFIQPFLFNEFLPLAITFNRENRGAMVFSSNFKLWWAAFSFDGETFEELEKTIDDSHLPEDTFKTTPGSRPGKKNTPRHLFIIAGSDWRDLEEFDDPVEAKEKLLTKDIPAAPSGKAMGLGKVFIKILLK